MLSDPLFLKACGILGLFGFGLYVLNYILLTSHRVTSNQCRFFAVNMLAAACVLLSQFASFNLPATLIQGFWIVLSLIAILKRMQLRRGQRRAANTLAPPSEPRQTAPEPKSEQMTRQLCTTSQRQMI